VGTTVSGDGRDVAQIVVGVHPFLGVSGRGPEIDLYYQQDRVVECEIPGRDQTPQPFPRRGRRPESALPGGHATGEERPNPTGQINGWKNILNVLSMTYSDHLGIN
jgi:hypothetical protein